MHEGHRNRLRETYLEHGASALHDHQLLELLLTFAIPRKDTNGLAHSLLAAYGSLGRILAADPYDLMRHEGVGRHAAVLLSLAGKLGQRGRLPRCGGHVPLSSLDAAARYCSSLFCGARHEEAYVISLDKRHAVLHADKISAGTPEETAIYPRLVVECALRHGASGVIIAHNHPSGNPEPSAGDIDTSEMIYMALGAVGIKMQDHIIIGNGCVYSMMRNMILHLGESHAEQPEAKP